MVKILLGNASTQVSVNGELTNSFLLSRSIRQGCPLAPLLYAFAIDGLNWVVLVILGNGEQVCIEMFADDTSIVVENDDRSIAQFWECIQIYCQASRSLINHSKTGMRVNIRKPPD